MMQKINFHKLFQIDLIAGKLFWKNPPKNRAHLVGIEAGVAIRNHCNKYYHIIKIDKKAYNRSRIIFYLSNGFECHDLIDHINGNSLDDRPTNLRNATYLENARNRKIGKPSKKLPMGIRMLPSGKFQARIKDIDRALSIGVFETIELAQSAYLAKRKELYNDFA